MATGDFDTYYSDEPWSVISTNQRQWYDPVLIDTWRQQSVFRPFLVFVKSNADVRAKTMTVTELLDPHADTTPLDLRQLWVSSMHLDSRSIDITFNHYGAKVAYKRYDDIVTYWLRDGKAGLLNIIRGALGQAEVDLNDMLARNALISGAFTTGYTLFGTSGSGTDFSSISASDVFDPDICMDIWLGMSYRGVPGAVGPSGAQSSVICFTSPGVIYQIQKDPNWVSTREYLSDRILLNYEVGSFKNVRFVQTPKCTLFNCGELLFRAPVTAAITAGDGAPDPDSTKVDGTYRTGQPSGVTNYIQLGTPTTGSMSTLSVNDIITIHATTTNSYGITGGVDFTEGKLTNRRIVSIDTTNKRIVLDKPVLVDFSTDLGSGVYAYATLGRNVHASIFVGGPQAVVAGVAMPPRFYSPPPIDDFLSVYRFSFDQYMGYQPYRPELFEVLFTAGPIRYKGVAKTS